MKLKLYLPILILALSVVPAHSQTGEIPLPEHPRPDWHRPDWVNLNGTWEFTFDPKNKGMEAGWASGNTGFDREITVPFPWGSALSGVEDAADIGWYRRTIRVDPTWKNRRVYLIIGASDWETTVWLDGKRVGSHQGGYVPIELELTRHLKPGEAQQLVIRADDTRRDFTLYGKQGYGNARGIWQTVYLEARGGQYLEALRLEPDIDRSQVAATAVLPAPATDTTEVALVIATPQGPLQATITIPAGESRQSLRIDMPDARLWTLDDPYLYEVAATLGDDRVGTYFGMRKISVANLPGTEYPYIALNGKPVYLQLALDQSYHPEGFYTFPSDAFMREEIERSKAIGLNGIRIHIKVEVPRKLYWADKLGLLVMADLPNSWGSPDAAMQAESEYTLRRMIDRDFNHPAIFSWIVFNETWGLTRDGKYTRDTQNWVASMYYLAKSLDTTRLAEDNSICCGYGHTETDINSWHQYLPGYKWDEHLREITENTYPGSPYHFEDGFRQGNQPLLNSECGNVWGYDGSTGDVDWSWDYHKMMNAFRTYPKVAGWLYTEHHDVVNEWNGYWRFDRSEKETGMGELVPGMGLRDLHAGIYLSTGQEISREVTAGSQVEVPLFLSDMSGRDLGGPLTLRYTLTMTNPLGQNREALSGSLEVAHTPWMQASLDPLGIQVPGENGLGLLAFEVAGPDGTVLSRNFMHLIVEGGTEPAGVRRITQKPGAWTAADWSGKVWEVLEGRKANGAGSGYFEYTFELPAGPAAGDSAYFLAELSAKEFFVKDRENYEADQDFMKGSRVAPSSNPNSYPMTDEVLFPSRIRVEVNGEAVDTLTLPDDPADHRGVLSWHYQLRDGKLREAGSYGFLVQVPIPAEALRRARATDRKVRITLQTEGEGGIAVYGAGFGRYPLDPTLVIAD
ncbi:glycoside hydrolase family 2 protein [Robiginitalea sp. SC105]|uniref:glycoside hydrolase family 2 protein n=1 Tax=Robiginitalea sp. SC105 TaxID=2762332 RepID=UPI00163AFCDF|nr:sugar-binding domain-containing protein [Robiginitalea sp. SC105]MBC2839539.1 glycoside hydrolase family 2 [Robiginitalea sp. SC105]